eukprot:TRINITY_DN37180_c0_g1_i1.p2 TRINITY_DN37180_c0_g1~~TRINITY_DN37180_c0_g1_i1.p2  ORF type:complete len:213 (+),score=71.13 TRINITY_DN37180_c0_g1_i1:85-639(+)
MDAVDQRTLLPTDAAEEECPEEAAAEEQREAKRRRRTKATRSITLDWRCPDCTWINWREFQNDKCYHCSRPRPSDEDLVNIEEQKKQRAESRKISKLRGGAEEARVREEMSKELQEATTFLEKTMEKEPEVMAQFIKAKSRQSVIVNLLAMEADVGKCLESGPDGLSNLLPLANKLQDAVKGFS